MKRFLLNVFEFYIQASIHVALAVISLLYVFTLSLEVLADKNLVFTLFFGTITGYNFVKYASVAKLYHRSLTRSLRVIQVFSLVCFLLMGFYAIKLPVRTLAVFGLIGFLTFAYAVPLISRKNIRSLSGLKIYVVAICWGLAVVIAPTVHYNFLITEVVLLKTLQIIFFVIALIIPFDIRDIVYDLNYLKTIPQQFGISQAKIIATILMLIFFGLEIYLQGVLGGLIVFPVCLLTITLVVLMPLKASKYYCSFYIESIPIFYGLIAIIQIV